VLGSQAILTGQLELAAIHNLYSIVFVQVEAIAQYKLVFVSIFVVLLSTVYVLQELLRILDTPFTELSNHKEVCIRKLLSKYHDNAQLLNNRTNKPTTVCSCNTYTLMLSRCDTLYAALRVLVRRMCAQMIADGIVSVRH
jgi:hypothetical protein